MKNESEMGLPSTLYGEVVHGKALGRTVGMPTANVHVISGQLPKTGVYATKLKVAGKSYGAVTNIGKRPSVDNEEYITVESFILDFDGNIYGEKVELDILKFLRPVHKFQSLEDVYEQVKKDVSEAKKYL